jgi:Zn-dependent M28 family amino/carboxypeptidase
MLGIIIAILLLALILFFWYSLFKIRFRTSEIGAMTVLSEDTGVKKLFAHVQHLSVQIGSRSVYEYSNIKKTETYIKSVLEELGLTYSTQEFRYRRNLFSNIVVSIPGREEPEDIFIIGAHYDTVSGTPGADDNGSGVAVLLELCRLLQTQELSRTLRLIFFVLEEPPAFHTPSMGSYVYAKQARLNKEKIYGMISLEMVGFFSNKKGGQSFPAPFMGLFYSNVPDFIGVVGNFKSRGLVKKISVSIKRGSSIAVESLSTFRFLPGIDWSDHGSFWKMGYPAVMITDTSFYRNPNYHKGSDTIETLDFLKMAEVVKGLIQVVRDLV